MSLFVWWLFVVGKMLTIGVGSVTSLAVTTLTTTTLPTTTPPSSSSSQRAVTRCATARTSIDPEPSSSSSSSAATSTDQDDDTEDDDNDDDDKDDPNQIRVSAEIELPFGPELAYDAFADLPRQPSWSPWLSSVVYVQRRSCSSLDRETTDIRSSRTTPTTSNDNNSNSNNNRKDDTKKEEEPAAAAAAAAAPHHHHNTNNVRGVESQWTMRYLGRKLSWTAITTHSQRPHLIAWESTRESILRNKGRVQFVSRSATAARSPTTTTTPPTTTCMKLTMSFTLPRFLARWHVLQRSSTIQHFIEHRMLQTTLQNFRDIVVTHDLPQSAWEEEEEASSSSSSSWRETTTTTRPRPRQHEQ